MKKSILAIALCVLLLSGCASFLNGEKQSVTKHPYVTAPPVSSSAADIHVQDYSELMDAVMGLVNLHEDSGTLKIISYDGDIESDVMRVCSEARNSTPLGAYVLSDVEGKVTKIVSYFEIKFSFTYRRTKEQADNIITAPSLRYFQSQLLYELSTFSENSAILTSFGGDLTGPVVQQYIKDLYYENPLQILMLPITTVNFYPNTGDERIVELTFDLAGDAGTMTVRKANLLSAVNNIADVIRSTVGGRSDGETLLALCQRLMDCCVYERSAVSDVSTQNFAATAYGALVNGSAIGEGYAMAYKALCDALDLECYVVLGTLDGKPHAWNIVQLGGYYYHVDVAMCDENGVDTAFLKSDEEMSAASYEWDRQTAKPCNGPETYEDLVSQQPSAPPTDQGGEPAGESPVAQDVAPTDGKTTD